VGVGDPLTTPKQARSLAARMERVYRDLWAELHRGDSDDLRQHERDLLSHLRDDAGVTLHWLADHLLLPKSTTSVLVKDLERRGFVRRERRLDNQRELSISLSDVGAQRVAEWTVLDTEELARVLVALPASELDAAIETLERVVLTRRSRRPPRGTG
jgi:DNA-binding MarR family transcriptional regulator